MEKYNLIQDKSYKFALRIVKLYQYLVNEKKDYIISKQILRCGTSIGANIEEAVGAQSKKDFFTKLTISYKEARETHYWIRLLTDSDFLSSKMSTSLLDDCVELLKIMTAIQKTVRKNLNN